MNKIEKLSSEGKMLIEFNKAIWIMINNGEMAEVTQSAGIIYKKNFVMVSFVINKTYHSETISLKDKPKSINIGQVLSLDKRVTNTLVDHLYKNAWYLFGYVESGNVRKNICVTYFVEIGMAFYAFMKEDDEPEKFLRLN